MAHSPQRRVMVGVGDNHPAAAPWIPKTKLQIQADLIWKWFKMLVLHQKRDCILWFQILEITGLLRGQKQYHLGSPSLGGVGIGRIPWPNS